MTNPSPAVLRSCAAVKLRNPWDNTTNATEYVWVS